MSEQPDERLMFTETERADFLKAKLAVAQATIERQREALEAIAKPDDLVIANPEVFSVHAFRRVQEIALAALSGGDK